MVGPGYALRAMVVAGGARLALAGTITGLDRALDTALFEISSRDPVTFILVPTLLMSLAVFAAYLPARMDALRTE